MNSKLHAVCDGQGRPLVMLLSEGQMSDYKGAALMVDALPKAKAMLGDRGYDADWFRNALIAKGITPCIPSKANRKWKPCFSKTLYRQRNLVERFFSKLKHFRRIATRYDKLAENFLAMVKLASIRLWLRTYESTT